MAQVILQQVRKVYANGYEAVKSIDLDIADGEFMVFVGPSGCAKSTTLRMVAGLEDISGGEIIIGDKRVNDLSPGKRSIAMVFQNYALYPHMKVRGNLAFGLKIAGKQRAEIDSAIDHVA